MKSNPLSRAVAYPLMGVIAALVWTIIIAVIVVFSQSVQAHGGRTNQYGCHNNSALGKFECHNSDGISLSDFELTDTELVAGAAKLGMMRKMHSETRWCYVYWRPISDTQFTFDSIGTCRRKYEAPQPFGEIVYPIGEVIATDEAVFEAINAQPR